MRDQAPQASPSEAPATRQKWIVCRVCLQQPKEPMACIFNDESTKDMTQMIMECGGVPIKKFDHYPDKICDKCSRALKIAFKFRQTCQNSYKHLRQFVAPVEVEHETASKQEDTEEHETAAEETEEELEEQTYIEGEGENAGDVAASEFQDEFEEEILLKLEKDNIVHFKSENVEEDGIIEEVYDVYEAFEGDIITEQAVFEQDFGDQSVSGLSADIEYLDPVEQDQDQDQDQLTESANEDEEKFFSNKMVRTAGTNRAAPKRRANSRNKTNDSLESPESATTITLKSGSRGNALKIRRGNNQAIKSEIVGEEGISIGEMLARKHSGIKTKGGHKIIVGDKKEFKYICDVCGNMYPSQSRLTEHIKVHSGIKPHECEICGHCFAQAQQLARHMNTHTGNRPYKCSYCPAAFADLSTRNKHHRIHTNERPYECDVCHKTFTYTNTLKFHKMIHTGEKPHVCDVCGKGFPQAYKLRNHKVIHERRNGREAVDGMMPYDTANIVGLEM
ncbi:uncharacterized protein Dana_GF17634 [Drosophila ananassae]|uniref:Protein krueppel n=1 Tax=Drosophila ananassae TaxID=7217 RepID=B3LXV3_DROAN|nr:zinc finger protein 62 homolog [Drosophila ananassae]EDV41760.1 uncharacterized protein Dana_GF17634 [Drosophila ananassae]